MSGDEQTDDEVAGAIREGIQYYIDAHHEFLAWLGLEVESMGAGQVTVRVPFDEKLTNIHWGQSSEDGWDAQIQGGVAATLIDTAGGIAFRPSMADPINDGVATINLSVNYLEPAIDDLLATAEVVRMGDTVGVAEVLVESKTPKGERNPVAIGMGAYRLFTDA